MNMNPDANEKRTEKSIYLAQECDMANLNYPLLVITT